MLRPRFVKAKKRNGELIKEYPVEVVRERMCSSTALKDIQYCLSLVTQPKGSGHRASSKYFPVSGKTGTAQIWTKHGRTSSYLVSFVGYFPANAPKYSCIVCIQKSYPASGGGHCGPVFKRIAEGVMARALVTCTEAKTAAIQALLEGSKYSNGIATGSGTDQTIIIANSASELYMEGAGKHSKLGELIGKTVKNAVKKALAKQSGLTPAKQHDVFRRLKRFDIKTGDMWQAYSAQDAAVVKPEYLLAAERLAKEDIMLVYTSLYVHLLDQHLWELISAKEMQLAGQKLLQAIAEQYNVEAEIINEGTLPAMLASWQQQFNKIIAQRLHPTAKES